MAACPSGRARARAEGGKTSDLKLNPCPWMKGIARCCFLPLHVQKHLRPYFLSSELLPYEREGEGVCWDKAGPTRQRLRGLLWGCQVARPVGPGRRGGVVVPRSSLQLGRVSEGSCSLSASWSQHLRLRRCSSHDFSPPGPGTGCRGGFSSQPCAAAFPWWCRLFFCLGGFH